MKTAPTTGSPLKTSPRTALNSSSKRADVIFILTVVVIMTAALIQTFEWPSEAAVFPRVVITSGLVFSVGLAITLGWKELHSRKTSGADVPVGATKNMSENNQSNEAEYIFATAGRRAWVVALLWITAFLTLMGTMGIFISSGTFALFYLRWGGEKSWKFSVIYAVILTLCLLTMFRWLLYIPTPIGILTGL